MSETFDPLQYPNTAKYITQTNTIYLRCPDCKHVVLHELDKTSQMFCPHCGAHWLPNECISAAFHTKEEFNKLCFDTLNALKLDERKEYMPLDKVFSLCMSEGQDIFFVIKESENKEFISGNPQREVKYFIGNKKIYDACIDKQLPVIKAQPTVTMNIPSLPEKIITMMFIVPDFLHDATLLALGFMPIVATPDKSKAKSDKPKTEPQYKFKNLTEALNAYDVNFFDYFGVMTESNYKTVTSDNIPKNTEATYYLNTCAAYMISPNDADIPVIDVETEAAINHKDVNHSKTTQIKLFIIPETDEQTLLSQNFTRVDITPAI